MSFIKRRVFYKSSLILMMTLSFHTYGQADIGIPVQVSGSSWNGEICLSDGIRSYYMRMPQSGTGEFFSYSDGAPYSLTVKCQPKTEDCRITSNASGIVSPGMRSVEITCTPKAPEKATGTKRTYTWALDESFNSQKFPLLSNVSTGNLGDDYFPPTTEPLAIADQSKWLGASPQKPTGQLKDFSLIYRTASTILPYSDNFDTSSYFNNWALIRKLIAFGGDTKAGSHVIAPNSNWIKTAHENGVKVYGTVFIGQDNQYTGLTDQLLGSSSCSDFTNDNACTYTIPTIEKLTALATKLKLDGWFLNIEAGLDDADSVRGRARVEHLKKLMRNKFPEIRSSSGVDFTVYSNLETLGIPGLVTDSLIADFGRVSASDHGLDNATGLSDSTVTEFTRFNNNDPQPYLMYLDEPYSRNTIRNEENPKVRLTSAKQTQCQYFNGISNSTWKGFKEYALAKYPSNVSTATLLCGGNTSEPSPKRVVKVTLLNGTSVSIDNSAPCSNDYASPALWQKTCMFEVGTDKSSITVSFTGENVKMATLPIPPYNKFGQELIPLIGAKWWSLNKTSNEGDSYFFDAYDYVSQGLTTYTCEAASSSATSCTVALPAADDVWNISAGHYGTPKQLNFIISAEYASFLNPPRS